MPQQNFWDNVSNVKHVAFPSNWVRITMTENQNELCHMEHPVTWHHNHKLLNRFFHGQRKEPHYESQVRFYWPQTALHRLLERACSYILVKYCASFVTLMEFLWQWRNMFDQMSPLYVQSVLRVYSCTLLLSDKVVLWYSNRLWHWRTFCVTMTKVCNV